MAELSTPTTANYSHYFNVLSDQSISELQEEARKIIPEIVTAETPSSFRECLNRCLQSHPDVETRSILDFIEERQQKVCRYSMKSFIGLPMRPNQKQSFRITKTCRVETALAEILRAASRINSDSRKRPKTFHYTLPSHPTIKLRTLCNSLCRQVFLALLEEVQLSAYCSIVNIEGNGRFEVRQKKGGVEQRLFVQATKGSLTCRCMLGVRRGIPCRHQIKVACRVGIEIGDLINKRWLLNNSEDAIDEGMRENTRGAGKTTRTNRLR